MGNQGKIVGLFSAVNESVWEHLKLLFIPILILTVIENVIYGKDISNFFFSRLCGVLAGMSLIVVVHYTYNGIIGMRFAFIDILLFYLGVILSYLVSVLLILCHVNKRSDSLAEIISIIAFIMIAASFFIFTYFPPSLAIFKSPV